MNDPPWITANFKNLIKKRQAAFSNGNIELFRYYRNQVNRERKICHQKFYSSKVEHLKKSKPSRWWKEVKQIAGMAPSTGAEDLYNQIQIDDMDRKSPTEIANFINTAFLDPMKIYQPLASLLPYDPNESVLQLDEPDVYKVSFSPVVLNFFHIWEKCAIRHIMFSKLPTIIKIPPFDSALNFLSSSMNYICLQTCPAALLPFKLSKY